MRVKYILSFYEDVIKRYAKDYIKVKLRNDDIYTFYAEATPEMLSFILLTVKYFNDAFPYSGCIRLDHTSWFHSICTPDDVEESK